MPLNPLNHHYSMENPASIYDEEAMTALELAGRTTAKVNETVTAFNKLETETNEHLARQDADIPVQVANKVQEHINGGTFDRQIDKHTAEVTDAFSREVGSMRTEMQETENDLSSRIDNLILDSGDSSSEVVDARGGYATLGTYLRETFGTLPVGAPYESGDYNLDGMLTPGSYVITSSKLIGGPNIGWGTSMVMIEGYGVNLSATGHPQYGSQTISNKEFTQGYRRGWHCGTDGVLTFTEWEPLHYEGIVLSEPGLDIGKIVEKGNYLFATTDIIGRPEGLGGAVALSVIPTASAVYQEVRDFWNSRKWFRNGRITANGTNFSDVLSVNWYPWEQVATHSDIEDSLGSINATLSNVGYNIINFGDSIFGACQDATSVSNYLATATGATVLNAGFGGCHMSLHWGADWTPFSMCSLADAVANGDFSAQEAKANAGVEGMPSYFAETVAKLQEVDFNEVDVITIGYGTNDYTSGDKLDDDGDDRYNKGTILGALRYSIETILDAYPNIRIAIVAPCYRYWKDSNGGFLEDSDTKIFYTYTLPEVVEGILEVAKEYHCPVVNPYYEMGVNKFNVITWTDDGTHPNTAGRRQLAKLISKTIKGM